MDAVRCTHCGETRWSLLPDSSANLADAPCELCGGPTVVERRRPGAGPDTLEVERRRAAMAARISGVLSGDSRGIAAR
jgi:hypothetical protein